MYSINHVLSSSYRGDTVHTVHLRYPRIIHAELMTHRVFGRNARSSRAVPAKVMLKEIEEGAFVPWRWTGNKPGMVGNDFNGNPPKVTLHDPNSGDYHVEPWDAWMSACREALRHAQAFADAGYHKQIFNRLVEPFMYIDTLLTGTEWHNFYSLRTKSDVEPHFRDMARDMLEQAHTWPVHNLGEDDYHLPYVTEDERHKWLLRDLVYISAARCARISYKPFDMMQADAIKDKLSGIKLGKDGHASPFDHIAAAHPEPSSRIDGRHFQGSHFKCGRNFVGL